jgi:hypothetical protein
MSAKKVKKWFLVMESITAGLKVKENRQRAGLGLVENDGKPYINAL